GAQIRVSEQAACYRGRRPTSGRAHLQHLRGHMIVDRRAALSVAGAATLMSYRPAQARKEAAVSSQALFTLRLATDRTQDLGDGGHGKRLVFPITGGSFEGSRLRGRVLSGGSDWTTTRSDGVMELDLRITLEADDKALIYMTFTGIRRGDYFRTLPRFET